VTPISLGIFASANQSAGATSYESIATVSVGSGGSSTITFSSIPATFTHLQIRAFVQTDRGTFGVDGMGLQINGSAGTNYAYHYLRGSGSAVVAAAVTSASSIAELSTVGCGTTTGGTFGISIIDILDYANTDKYKTIRNLNGADVNGLVGGVGGFISLVSGLWMQTNAITSLVFNPNSGTNFTQYSHFALYGIRT